MSAASGAEGRPGEAGRPSWPRKASPWRPRRSTGSWCAAGSPGCATSTSPVRTCASRSGAMSTTSPATWCMSMSRSSAGSRTVADPGTRPRLGRAASGERPRHANYRARKKTGGRVGYVYLHTAIDDHSRLAYTEELLDEKGSTAAAFLGPRGRVLPPPRHPQDPAGAHRQRSLLPLPGLQRRARPAPEPATCYTRPYRPQTNGKVERYHRTLAREWAYRRAWHSNEERAAALTGFLHRYNYHRPHTALARTTTSLPAPRSVSPTSRHRTASERRRDPAEGRIRLNHGRKGHLTSTTGANDVPVHRPSPAARGCR